jgi:TPP-dependent pyruvate/acetoin dehydrogenase alpha subunit
MRVGGESSPVPKPLPNELVTSADARRVYQDSSMPELEKVTPSGDPRLIGADGEEDNPRLYRRMRFIRRFEEELLGLFDEGLLRGTTHACIGQEADCVGVIEHLRPGDHIFSNHRCHGHYLAWTGDAIGLLAEIMGKEAGVVRGVGGSQHLCAPGFKSNGILGGTVPAAAGIALAMKRRGGEAVSTVFIGDGTFGEGVLYETLNIASLWSLPLLVVAENNGYAQSTPISANFAGDMAARFDAFGIEARRLESTDVLEISAAAAEAIASVRAAGRPRALVIDTYRLCHHSKSDDNRPEAEIAARWEIEPLVVHGARIDADERSRIDREVDTAIAEIVERARRLPS